MFRNITLLNTEKSGSSVRDILNNAYAVHVRNLHYMGIKAMSGEGEPLKQPSPVDFPNSVEEVLSTLSKLPNLEKVTVQFASAETADEDEDIYVDSFYNFDEPEDDEQVLEAERTEAFRSLMERSYRALSCNPKATIKHLELKNVIAKKCSAWQLEGFRILLQGLTSFNISLRGGDNGAGWKVNKLEGYLEFVSELDAYFFRYLSHVKHFKFAATHDGPPGIEGGMNNTALPLLRQYMPQLQSLSLEYVFISGDLTAFITSHSDTLESIWLNQCYSDTEWPETNTITWGAFFSSIAAKDMKALSVFDVAPSDLERLCPTGEKHYRHQEAVRAQELREKFPARRMFDYKHLDDKYGMVFDSEEKAFERFENGSDHSGWRQLCRIVERNSGLEPCMCRDDAHWR